MLIIALMISILLLAYSKLSANANGLLNKLKLKKT